MLPAVLVPELVELSSALAVLFGLKKFNDSKEKVFPLFPFTAGVSFVVNKVLDDVNEKSKQELIFDYKDFDKKENLEGKDFDYVKFKIFDNLFSSLNDVKDENDLTFNLESVVKRIDVPEIRGDNLLDVLKSNSEVLVSVLSSLNNTITSSVVSTSFSTSVIAKSINSLVRELVEIKKILLLNSINSDYISKSLVKVAEAKELEKEHFEYMKTPKTYSLIDDTLPELAPRDVIALSEVVKAYLNSQEASLTGEELEEFENDFNLSNVISLLFNFSGITKDIENLPKE